MALQPVWKEKMSQLSICIPSNRKLIDSQRSIDSALTFSSQRNNCEISVSDNSGDPEKFLKYSESNNRNLIYSTCDFNESNNGKNALDKSSGQFVGFMADDDFLIALGPQQNLVHDKSISGYRPNFAIWEKDLGITRTTNFNIIGKTAKERIQCYFKNSNGNNNTLYSFFRRDLAVDIGDLCAFHPIKAGYYDWAIVLAHASSGNIYSDNSTLYVYDNHNWSGSQNDINLSIKNLLKKGGLNDRAPLFLYLLLAIDSFILISRNTSPLEKFEALDAAMFAFAAYLKTFINAFNTNKSQFTQAEVATINKITETNGLSNLLTSTLNVLEVYNPSLIQPYLDFYFISTGKKWGEFNIP